MVITHELSGDPRDPMTAKRGEVFKPLAAELGAQMARSPSMLPKPTTPSEPSDQVVENQLYPCDTCNRTVAMVIYGDKATDEGRFEDYARGMYGAIRDHNVPAWIVGPPSSPDPDADAEVLKVWPTREPIRRISPDDFNAMLEELMRSHCPNQPPPTADDRTRSSNFLRLPAVPKEAQMDSTGPDASLRAIKEGILLDDIAKIHAKVRGHTVPPADQRERELRFAMEQAGASVQKLLLDGASPYILETALFVEWLRLACEVHGIDERKHARWGTDLNQVMLPLANMLKELEATIQDDGPIPEMRQLGEKLDAIKDRLDPEHGRPTSREDTAKQSGIILTEIHRFLGACIDEHIPAFFIESALLYYWFRCSVNNHRLKEAFFQKLERHWMTVMGRIGDFLHGLP
jgi:hypothetical protein